MKKILTFNGVYVPGFKAGGPIKSLKNMVENLADKNIQFYIVSKDKDLGDSKPYPNIKINSWNRLSSEYVFYHSNEKLSINKTFEIYNSQKFDKIYLNGVFSHYTLNILILKKLKKINNIETIICPRGDLDPGALESHSFWKKYIFLKTNRLINLYKDLVWHFTSEEEKKYTECFFEINKYYIIPNLIKKNRSKNPHLTKNKHFIKIIYISRIDFKKNLLGTIDILSSIKDLKIHFDIYGPISNNDYWKKVKSKIKELPKNISVKYFGAISPNDVDDIFIKYDLFLFPTFGENYGHAIIESLSNGTPVLISDKTPWKDLMEKRCGWAFDIKDKNKYINVIYRIYNMNEKEFIEISNNAFFYYVDLVEKQKNFLEKYADMFLN